MAKENIPEKEMAMFFRPSTDSDFNFVFELNKTNMRKYVEQIRGWWNEEREREDMKKKFTPGVDKIIQINGQDVGILRTIESDSSIKLEHIELLPEFHGMGIGRKIIGDLLARGKKINLRVLKKNPAVGLYKKIGFKIVGQTKLKYLMSA